MRHEYLGPRPELFGSALDMFINTNLMLIHDNKSGARRNTPPYPHKLASPQILSHFTSRITLACPTCYTVKTTED